MRDKIAWRIGGMLLGTAAGGLLLWYVTRGIDFSLLVEHGSEIRPGSVLLALLLVTALLWLSACEWKLFLSAANRRPVIRLYRIVAVMSLLQNVVHHLAGHAYALFQLVRGEGLSPAAAASIIALDQVAEGFAKFGLIAPLAFYVAIPGPLGLTAAGLAVGAVSLYALLLFAAAAARRRRSNAGENSDADPRWLRIFTAWGGQLADVMSPRRMLIATILACTKKLLRAGAVYCVQASLSLALPWYVPLIVVGAVDVATLIPIAPGHLGIFEAAVCLVYSRHGVEPERALLVALLFHAVSLYATIAPGLAVICWKAMWLSESLPDEASDRALTGELPGLEPALPGPAG